MVDNSDCVLCCYSGTKDGGTYNTIKYAEREGKKMILIDLSENGENKEKKDVQFIYKVTL